MLDLAGLTCISDGVFIIHPPRMLSRSNLKDRKYRFFAEKDNIVIKFDYLKDFSKWIGLSHKRVVRTFHQGKLVKGWYIDEYV